MEFAKLLVQQINARTEIGLHTRLAISVYGERSQRLTWIGQHLTADDVSTLIDAYQQAFTVSTTTSNGTSQFATLLANDLNNVYGVLLEARDHLQARTQQRIVADWSVQQVVILLKSSAAVGDDWQLSRDIYYNLA